MTPPVKIYFIRPLSLNDTLTTSYKAAIRLQHQWVKRVVRQAIEMHKELHSDEPVTLSLLRRWWKMFIVYHEIGSLSVSLDGIDAESDSRIGTIVEEGGFRYRITGVRLSVTEFATRESLGHIP